MTRVNIGVPPSELCDQHLLAEYRELPRCVAHTKRAIQEDRGPREFCLGTGHVLWCARNPDLLVKRFNEIVGELWSRGFRPSYGILPGDAEFRYMVDICCLNREEVEEERINSYARPIVIARLQERLKTMKVKPRWTRREAPSWASER